jgi:hypothetical protein
MFERDYMYLHQVRKDALRTAAKERLIRQIQVSHPPVRMPYRLWAARLGEQMVVWGRQLQARYASS